MQQEKVKEAVKAYLLQEFLPEENPADLTESTPLITQGILDSLATLELVSFLEETYGIKVEAHEVSIDNMNTIADIASFVGSKCP